MPKNWFITGSSRGLGKEFARAALARGDRVAATARDVRDLDDLVSAFGDAVLPLPLDVTDRAQVTNAVEEAIGRLGRLDVVVNNAGYGLFGMVEEMTPQELHDQLDVNLFGVLHVTQAVLPVLRAQGSGHIVQISTIGGQVAFPGLGGYHASKWALEGLTEALAQEIAPFGIRVTLVEPGGYATDWGGSSAKHTSPQSQYDFVRAERAERRTSISPNAIGDPVAAGVALLDVVDAPEPPSRVLFGTMANNLVPGIIERRLQTWKEWEKLGIKANGHEG
jgi:NAD(P)-dependent dehydrogenase (short-subunit alcohol dehydrogenase family)